MTTDNDFMIVKNARADKKLAAFRAYCELMIAREEKGGLSIEEAAYHICGTGYSAIDEVDRGPIVEKILNHASSLELPPQHRVPNASWTEMVELVKLLPY